MVTPPQFRHIYVAQYAVNMRLRLAHTQALLLLSAVLLTVLCMGALNAWHLRNGFSDYLASRDVERLENFAAMVSARVEQAGGLAALQAQGVDVRILLREFGQAQGAVPGRGAPPPGNRPAAFRNRVALYAPDGQPLLGPPLAGEVGEHVERPIHLKGQVIAVARMRMLKPAPNDMEARFLTTQYKSIAVAAVALLLVALFCARWIAGHWVRPLIDIQFASERIAQGKFETRLHTRRTDEIGDAMRNINRMAEGLQRLEASRHQWIADISHELRTPLTVLHGEIEALIDGVMALSPKSLMSLREEALRLNALVEDLHLLAMADLRALPCYFEECDARALAADIVQRFAMRAQLQGLTLRLQVQPDVPILMRWDAKRIGQLLGNLLDNSLRYTDAPGQVLVTMRGDAAHVVITVEDTAPGVSSLDLSRIFEPLYRADPSRGRAAGGSGLGLAICEQIARAHHGTLQAEASALGGVLLRVTLPTIGDRTA